MSSLYRSPSDSSNTWAALSFSLTMTLGQQNVTILDRLHCNRNRTAVFGTML